MSTKVEKTQEWLQEQVKNASPVSISLYVTDEEKFQPIWYMLMEMFKNSDDSRGCIVTGVAKGTDVFKEYDELYEEMNELLVNS